MLGDQHSRYLYALLVGSPSSTLVGVAITTSWLALLGLVFLRARAPATRVVLSGTTGRGLVPVLQQTGVAELLYAAGVFVGLLIAS